MSCPFTAFALINIQYWLFLPRCVQITGSSKRKKKQFSCLVFYCDLQVRINIEYIENVDTDADMVLRIADYKQGSPSLKAI